MTAMIAIAVAKGLLQHFSRSLVGEFGGPVELNKSWGYSLLIRMKYVQRKATTSKSKYSVTNFEEVK